MDAAAQPAEIDLPALGRSTLDALVDGLLDAAARTPAVAALFVLLVAVGLLRTLRTTFHSVRPRDPVRRFSRADKAAILTRAGQRCEQHALLFGRCRAVDRLEADHVHPWSRGGRTALINGQALCRRHNKQKGASIPFRWQVRRLQRRRDRYISTQPPPGIVRLES